MIARRRQVALVLTAVLAAAAACQAQEREGSAPPGRPAPAAARAFTLVASGDVLPDSTVAERARFDAGGNGYDFRPMLAGAAAAVSRADVALCHMGAGYGEDGDNTAHPTFQAPPDLALGLAMTGYDGCSTASAHALDGGAAGIRQTLDLMDHMGLRHTGTARTESEARTVTILPAGPAKVAHLSYTFDTSGVALPPAQPWAVNLIDERRVIADARAARKAGADVVVVSLHWGTEGQDQPDERQLTLAKRLTASRSGGRPDLDLVLGTRAHVPQAYEKVNGTWVVYGLGDQIAGQQGAQPDGAQIAQPDGQQVLPGPRGIQSTIARFTFTAPGRPGARWEVTRAEYIPQMYDLDAGRVVDLNAAIASGADLTGVRDHVRDAVLSRGAAKDGLVMGE
ncbi:CapA family protein [Streptomyces sp. NPDC086787]|uniref:CapA family protein n=1 Tax=Streptomyces sp. NPDC086787 TaxID=3365759 RepID=UPI003806B592